jgi:LysR family transcriptional regulator, mexEF-oprN operon transcriptional activator
MVSSIDDRLWSSMAKRYSARVDHCQSQGGMTSSAKMMRRGDLDLLLAFDALMVERNLRIAGERLGKTQPAMSAALARLRDRYADRLFVKVPTGVEPTPRAIVLWEELRAPLAQLRDIVSPASFDPASAEGEYVVGLSEDLLLIASGEVVATIHAEAPKLCLRFTTVDHRSAEAVIASGSADVVISPVAASTTRGLARRELFRMPFVLLFDPKTGPPPATIKDYARRPHVAIAFTDHDRGFVADAREQAGASAPIALTPDFAALPTLIRATGGVATVPGPIALYLAKLHGLAIAPSPLKLAAVNVSMIWHERRTYDPKHDWLRERVRSAVLKARSSID